MLIIFWFVLFTKKPGIFFSIFLSKGLLGEGENREFLRRFSYVAGGVFFCLSFFFHRLRGGWRQSLSGAERRRLLLLASGLFVLQQLFSGNVSLLFCLGLGEVLIILLG